MAYEIIEQWQIQILLTSALLAWFSALLACIQIRSVKDRLTTLIAVTSDQRSLLDSCLQDRESLRDELQATDVVCQQLRQQTIELRVRSEDREQQIVQFNHTIAAQQQELKVLADKHTTTLAELAETRIAANIERAHQQEKLAEKQASFEQSRTLLKQELQLLANNILEKNTNQLATASEAQLKQVLLPVKDQLQSFRKKIEDVYEKEAQQRFSLVTEVNKLQGLNERISDDAVALTNALKGENKIAGNWGEMILERLLESSGLTKGREFQVQSCFIAEADGRRLQPDVIINLPHGKAVIIDSKVSLAAYERLYSAQQDNEKNKALTEHIVSIKQHIRGLSKKKYQQINKLKTLDFVLLFVPVEGAFVAAIREEPGLLTDSYQRNVILVSPSTLLATLRVIKSLWQQERQNRNAIEIARLAGSLYDKFAGFSEDLLTVGQRLEQSHHAYQQALDRLSNGRGNLLSRVEKLKTLGARNSKTIPVELLTGHNGQKNEAM